jgi:uncharacterized protein DUF551
MEWINVTERLPEICETVLVYGHRIGSGHNFVRTAEFSSLTGSSGHGYEFIENIYGERDVIIVSHWMPFPDPPIDKNT